MRLGERPLLRIVVALAQCGIDPGEPALPPLLQLIDRQAKPPGQAFDRLTLVLPLITIVLIALSLWLSVNRRRTVLQLAVGVCLLMIVERRVVIHEQGAMASAAHNPQVAQSVLGDLLHGFFVLTGWVLGVALAVLVIAVLSGPYRWAVALRSQVTRTWRSIAAASSGDRRGQVVTWMASHAAGLQ